MKNEEEIEVNWGDDSDLDTLANRMRVDIKGKTTNYIAVLIVAVFAGTLICALIGGILICVTKSPTEAEATMTKAFLPFLQGLASFISTLFGSAVALILVYYFRPPK